jgi:hypothetical protein
MTINRLNRDTFNLGLREVVYFTSSGTFTKASYPWLRALKVRMVGGGGGSGHAPATSGTQVSTPGSGGGGGYCEKFYTDINSLSASITVTIGAGGTGGTSGVSGTNGGNSTFVSMTANGGAFGDNGTVATVAGHFSNTGAGGGASGGDINITGSGGIRGNAWALDRVTNAIGGQSLLSGHIQMVVTTTALNSSTGLLYGGGATAPVNAANQSARNGGTGAAGIVILELYA